MKSLLIALTALFSFPIIGQTIDSLDGKWALTGSRSILFSVEDSVLYLSNVHDRDEAQFSSMMSGDPNFKTIERIECEVDEFNDYIFISANLGGRHNYVARFIYNFNRPNQLSYLGDVYYPESRVVPNENCNMDVPHCEVILRDVDEWNTITLLPLITTMPREEVISLIHSMSAYFDTVCNSCYEGIPGANWNSHIIDLGYNPVIKDHRSGYDAFGIDERFDTFTEEGDPEVYAMIQALYAKMRNRGETDE